jgi:uncharacterized protein YcbK (DUF882 family)
VTPRAHPSKRVASVAGALVLLGVTAGATLDVDARPMPLASAGIVPSPADVPARRSADLLPLDSVAGRSGKLRAVFVAHSRPAFAIQVIEQLYGDSALDTPRIYTLDDSTVAPPVSLITLLPFSAKRAGRIGAYRIGDWPHERSKARANPDELPDGFVEVTPDNVDTYVSEHFRLRDFLTHDQENVWPKYLVLDTRLIDKLELVIEDLRAHGIPVRSMAVMSGFRTPQYNRQGVGRGGRASDSRHQYGDAADVFVDNTGSGRMSDLNRDGRVDWRDARVIRDAVDRVEARHPDLVGGVGLYRATRAHGPFAHVDARGERARWGP